MPEKKSADRFMNQAASKLVYIISLVNKSMAFEHFFGELAKHRLGVTVVFLHPEVPELMKQCDKLDMELLWIPYEGKKDLPAATWKLFHFLRKRKPDVVHTHLFDASMAGLTAAWLARVPVRIHTRHHASHHHVYFPHAVKYDRFINRLSTRIFAISENIKEILVRDEKVDPDRIAVVYHGFNLKDFGEVSQERVRQLRDKYDLPAGREVIGMISRFTFWKGVQDMIGAFKMYLKTYPSAVLVLANARGDYEQELKVMLTSLPADSYRLIDFEQDSPALYQLFDIFVHLPIDDHSEAFGQVYVEALAAGIPAVVTRSGIALEFIIDRHNALVVPYQQPEAVYHALVALKQEEGLRNSLRLNGRLRVSELFGVEAMVQHTLELYNRS